MAISREERSVPTTLLSKDGQVVGDVTAYHVDQTDLPVFAQVKVSPGRAQIIVPVLEGEVDGDKLTVPYSYDQIQDAPQATLGLLSASSLRDTIEHYRLAEVEPGAPQPEPPEEKPSALRPEPPEEGPLYVPRRPPPIIIPAFVHVNRPAEG
ncbi:hypothetical protein [Streptomyces decoyicus]|uniref:hypothetical protein n=1 Tax=Streptomyces decoyicus TaxID=249567 RepID=UPI0004AB56B1|nr:hypothetical protein [Streptomyces decoyicus]KOG41217.1 hypothetical protein ADK74_21965 [Streptomyces decoyicus]QZY20120.1 hypothetical protein K7C20_36985 [Streptomyces decoyicus]